jgi:hypothetical protein
MKQIKITVTIKIKTLLLFDDFPLHYPREKPDETGTTGSLHRFGLAADRLGGEDLSHRASASGGSTGKMILAGRDC